MPRDNFGFLDERTIYNLLGKCNMPYDCLYDIYPYEFVFYIEGKLDSDREYFEYMNYSLFSSIRQSLGKGRTFDNPFTKKESNNNSTPTQAEKEHTFELIDELFGLNEDIEN